MNVYIIAIITITNIIFEYANPPIAHINMVIINSPALHQLRYNSQRVWCGSNTRLPDFFCIPWFGGSMH